MVPAYNEASVIVGTLRPLLEAGFHIVLVDDGSTDETYAAACTLPVHVLRHPVNLGQGAALQTGITYALKCGAEAVVHFDADGQHDPGAVARLLAPVISGQAEVALGSRFLQGGGDGEIPRLKRWILRFACGVTRAATGMRITDTHNGLRAFTAPAARRLHIRENRMAHASEILGAIRKLDLRYVEVPVRIRYTDYSRRKGQSIFNALNILIDLCLRRIFQ